MAIKGNLDVKILIADTDTTALNPTAGRASVTFASLENTTASDEVVVEAFKATTASPAATDRIWSKTLSGGESVVPAELLTGIPKDSFLVLIVDSGNSSKVNLNLGYTQYSGDD
jgi:hypothetical protein